VHSKVADVPVITPVESGKQARLRKVDIEVLEGLALYGPRNKSKLATSLDMPIGTLRYRINYLRSHFSLYLQGNLYHTYLGLKKVMVFAESRPGYEDLLYQCLKSNDYWLYVSRCIAAPKCIAIYGIPAGKEGEFEGFMGRLRELDQVCDVNFYWSTCIHNVNTTRTWFDDKTEEWIFPWDSWLKEVRVNEGNLPPTLKEIDRYPQKADQIDIIILKELEKDCTVRLKEIAKKLDMSLQRVKYHFEKHVIEEGMFEGYQIIANHYKGLSDDTYYFRFDFKTYENFKRFALSLINKPFARAMGKAYGKNQLLVQIYLPRSELRNFLEALSKLVRSGFLETYEYVIQDLAKTERQTISYEFFKDGGWEYAHEKHLEKLKSSAERFLENA
jgi:DNA-binding Lrp family transcriptional regulator